MVELIVVIVVVGVLGATAGARFFGRQAYDVPAAAAQMRSLIRYGQKLAIARNAPVFVVVRSVAGATPALALCLDLACTSGNTLPAASGSNSKRAVTLAACAGSSTWACEALPENMAMSGATSFRFNALGVPFATTDGAVTSSFAQQNLTFGQSGTTDSVVIEADTGYVH